jgi:hypothetical protein
MPVWAIRPGAYAVLEPVVRDMPLWLAIHSRNAEDWRPCYHTREQLADTIGIGRTKVTEQFRRLRRVGLLFEVGRGQDPKTKKHLPPARFALDPMAHDLWRPEVEKMLARIAEEDGHDGRWYQRAVTSLDAFHRRAARLRALLLDDMPFAPRRPRRRRRAGGRERRRREPGPDSGRGPDPGRKGMGYPGGDAHGGSASGTHESCRARMNGPNPRAPADQHETRYP